MNKRKSRGAKFAEGEQAVCLTPGGCGEKRRAPARRHGAPGHEAERRVGLPGAGTGHGPHRDLVGGHDGEADGMSAFGWICAYIGAAWLAGTVLKCVEALGR